MSKKNYLDNVRNIGFAVQSIVFAVNNGIQNRKSVEFQTSLVSFQVAVSTWLLYRTFVLTPVCCKHVCLKACRLSGGNKLWTTHGLPFRALVYRGGVLPGPTGVPQSPG